MTLIAVTQRTEYISQYKEMRDCLDQRWYELLISCNLTPLLIPNYPKIVSEIIKKNNFQGVLLTGGNNSLFRIETENLLFKFAIKKKMPVLGICHGMQFIQQYFGIKLQKVFNHITEQQEILINDIPDIVNSYHNYGTTQASAELATWAKTKDGLIKAIQHCTLPIIGIMWHPERCYPFRTRDIQLIKKFFSGEQFQCEQSY